MRAILGASAAGLIALALAATFSTPASAASSAARPRVAITGATHMVVPASGGLTRITANVWNASVCLWSGEWAGTSVSTNAKPAGCPSDSAGRVATETLSLPANGSDVSRTWVVYLIAKGPGGTSRWSHLDITQQGISSTTPSTTSTPTTSTSPSATSTNWSGYVLPSSSLVTEVGARWTVPTLNCSATPNAGAAEWVGIGGVTWPTGGTSGTLLQTGISTDCVNGAQQNHGWFEELPSTPNFSRPFLDFPVSPGDSIDATVFEATTGAWETRVDDLTTGQSGVMVTGEGWGIAADSSNGSFPEQGSTSGLSYSGGYTGEWIVEDYGQGASPDTATLVPLADFGTITFSDLTTSLASWSLTAADSYAIFQGGSVLSQPSPASSNGFSVSYAG